MQRSFFWKLFGIYALGVCLLCLGASSSAVAWADEVKVESERPSVAVNKGRTLNNRRIATWFPTPQPTATSTPSPVLDELSEANYLNSPSVSAANEPSIQWRVLTYNSQLYRNLDIPSADTVSGVVGIQIIVKVPPKTRLASNSIILRIQEKPDVDHNIIHPFERDHIDLSIPFGNRWQVWHNRNPALSPGYVDFTSSYSFLFGNCTDFNESNSTTVYYTTIINWNSTNSFFNNDWDSTNSFIDPINGILLGHNGAHSVSIVKVDGVSGNEVCFTNSGGQYICHPEQTEYNLKNVVINEVSTNQIEGKTDYIKFDPLSDDDSLKEPVINFKIDDLDEGFNYYWTLKVWSMKPGDYSYLSFQGQRLNPGLVSVALNAPSSNGQTQSGVLSSFPKGIYTFSIQVQEWVPFDSDLDLYDTYDPQEYGSTYNGYVPGWIGDDMKPTYSGNPRKRTGYTMDIQLNNNGEEQASVRYYLSDEPDYNSDGSYASSMDFSAFKVELIPRSLRAATATYNAPADKRKVNVFNPPLEQPETVIHTFSGADEYGPYTAMFTGVDGHAEEYRDHLPKRIWPQSVTVNSSYISLFFWDYLTEEMKAEVDNGPTIPTDYNPELDSSLTGEESTEKPPYCAGVDASTVSPNTVTVKWWYSDEKEADAHATELSSIIPTESISDAEWQTKWGMSLEQKQAYDERGGVATVLKHKFNATTRYNYLFLKVTVSPDGVLDNVGNVYDANPETEVIETSAKYTLKVAEGGALTIVRVTYE